jgi:hypothetical protein
MHSIDIKLSISFFVVKNPIIIIQITNVEKNNANPKENVTNVKGSISHYYILDASGQFKTFNTIVLTPKPNTAPP